MPEIYEEDTIDLREYWQALMRRKWIVIIIFIAAVVSAALASQFMTPIYEATTSIMVQDKNASMGQLSFLEGAGVVSKNVNQNYVEVLKSRTLALRAAEMMGRHYDPNSAELAAFRNSIAIQLVSGTDAIRIKVQSPDRNEARDIANTLVEAFIEHNQEVNTEEARSARFFIEDQLKGVEADLRKAEDELRSFKEKEKVVAPSEEGKAILTRLTELEKAKAETTVTMNEAQRQLDEYRKKLKAEQPTTVASTTISNNPLFSQYKVRLADLETQLVITEQQYTSDHPRVAAIKAEIASVRAQMDKEVERIVSSETMAANPNYQTMLGQTIRLEVDIAAQQAKQKALDSQIGQVEKSLTTLPDKEVKLTRLMRNQSVLESVFLLLKNKYEEYKITEAVKASGVQRLDEAITPQSPVKPRKKMNVAIAGFLGLFVGVGMVFMLEFLDTTLKTAEDIERYMELPVLGRIPMVDGNGDKRSGRRRRRRQRMKVFDF